MLYDQDAGRAAMDNKDDMVYLLSMTFHASDGGCELWLGDDYPSLAPTVDMGDAKAFNSENEAREYRDSNNMNTLWQITPISGVRYFKAKLQGTTR
jgi:hypothetical protein